LLLVGLQVPRALRLRAHALHGVHHIVLLREKRIAEISGPLDVVCETFDHIGQSRQSLDARVPRLLGHSVCKRLIFHPGILTQPLLKLYDFKRIRRGRQNLRQHRIGIKRDGRYERIQLVSGDFRRLSLSRRRLSCLEG
jgi:hypothetical protein